MDIDERAPIIAPIVNDPGQPSLLQLNDDCLMSIFQHLSNNDLISVNQCSQRLQTLISRSISHRDATHGVHITELPSKLLQVYGNIIQNLRVSRKLCVGIDAVKYIQRFCPKLKKFDASFTINVFLRQNLGDIFAELDELVLHVCEKPSTYKAGFITTTMKRLKKVHSLKLNVASFKEYFSVEYPQLRKLTLVINSENFACISFPRFIEAHSHIQSLRIDNSYRIFDYSLIFVGMNQFIGQMTNFTECILGSVQASVRSSIKDIVSFVKAAPSLNILKITSIELDKVEFHTSYATLSTICGREDVQLLTPEPFTYHFGTQNVINVFRTIPVRI